MFALLDMDSFYAQVECKRLGLSNDVPLGVQQHEHFIAVNYAARKKGVPSRCAVDKAKEICPGIIAAEVEMIHNVKPSLERYRRASEQVLNVLLEFFDEADIEKASIDEAYLNLFPLCSKAALDDRLELKPYEKAICKGNLADEPSEERRLIIKASNVMSQVRQAIFERLGFTSSCGIAHNKLLAKISASKNKPAGQTIVLKSGAKLMMRTTDLRKIKGLGGKLGKSLQRLYVKPHGGDDDAEAQDNVLGAIQDGRVTFATLEKALGTKTARYVVSRANGEDDSEIVSKIKPKTLLSIKTFYHSLSFDQVLDWLRLESGELARRVVKDNELFHRVPRTLVLHLHRNDGEHISRRMAFHANQLADIDGLADDIYRTGEALLRTADVNREGGRGVGMRLENFSESSVVGSNCSSSSTVPRITEFFTKAGSNGAAPSSSSSSSMAMATRDGEDEAGNDGDDDDDIQWADLEQDSDVSDDGDDEVYAALEDDDDSDMEKSDENEEAEEEDIDGNQEEEYQEIFSSERPAHLSPAAQFSLALRRPQTSSETGASAFVAKFFRASRLSFIGSWKRRFESLLDSIPAAPPLPPPSLGERVILHVDMDAFFCTASLLKRPDLKDKPVAVCWSNVTSETSTTSSAEISSCNYIARGRGVKASMSLARAKLLCPELTCIPFDFELYESIGMTFYQVLFDLTPHVEGVSCDEAYLDVTHLVADRDQVNKIAERLRATVFERTGGVTASVGAGKNRLIARLSTAKAKPDGSLCNSFASDEEIFAKLLNEEVDVRSLPSVGYSTCDKLKRELDVATVKELRAVPLSRLKYLFGPRNGEKLFNLCRGVDSRPWNPRPLRDSVSVQISWGVRMQNLNEVHEFLGELARECYNRLGTRNGDAVNLKVWRAVENQPDHHRKGQVGHGVCDILTRSKPQVIRGSGGGGQSASSFASSSSSSAASSTKPSDERTLLASAIELFTDLRVAPEDVRGLGLCVTGLAGGVKVQSAVSGAAAKRRKVATNVPSPSRWVEGVGVVTAKRYKSENKTKTSASDQWESYLRGIVDDGYPACCEVVDKELVYAFEETRCDRWPGCERDPACQCLRETSAALEESARLVIDLVKHGAAGKDLVQFARQRAHAKYGILPKEHFLSRLNEMGGGILFFEEALADMCEAEDIR